MMKTFIIILSFGNGQILGYKHTDGYYYFTGSVPGYQVIELRRAKSLNELEHAASLIVWQAHEEGPMSELIWAPEVHYINGKWYIYFAASNHKLYVMNLIITACSYLKISIDPMNTDWIERDK